jgi:beta-mannosidase
VDHVQFFNTAPDGAYNECGVAGPSLPSLIRASAPAAEVWPPKRGGVWEFHKAFGTWGDGNTWLLPELIERYFGPVSRLEDLCRAGQFLQAIGIQYLLEEMRRRWPNVPGVMPWCFNTPWTSFAGSFVVAYPDSPLPAYYALQKAYAPRSVSARLQSFVARPGETVRIGVHVLNDGGAPVGPGSVQMEAGPIGGKPWVRRTLDAPGVQTMGRAVLGDVSIGVPASFEGVITIALRWRHAGGEETNRSYIGVAAEPATGSAAEPATGVAAGTAPAACFRPLIDLWEKDPSMRMAAME